MLREPSSVGKRNSTRVDEGRKGAEVITKARIVVGRGEKLGDPRCELRLGREKEREKV